ncbi:MAG: hypothetical protein NZM43_06015 [Saprospiraceae bacterium]|nr:hypothetical protein [Saprospiraceae bacterium]MDW8483865.1 hypothetical protein [Saprospiraceae bacterium]
MLQVVRGDFQKQVAVIALDEPSKGDKTAFLEKILTAVGLDLHKDTLFAAIQPNRISGLGCFLREKQPRVVLVFGVAPRDLGMQIELFEYQPIKFHQAIFLRAHALAILETNREFKGRLWNALKKVFLS